PAPELQTRCPGSATDESRIALADAVHTLAVKWDSLPALRQETLLRVIKDLCDVPGGRTTSKST
ncbi:MAG: hypothetical protein NTU41_02950, partial [Chloroflexi bacterium]|nr:hypothetical protein [Chloroflexota bacterium]